MASLFIAPDLLGRVVELHKLDAEAKDKKDWDDANAKAESTKIELGYIVGVTAVDDGRFFLLIAMADNNLVEAMNCTQGSGFVTVGDEYDAEVYLTNRMHTNVNDPYRTPDAV